jgi:hypothetical protein
MPQALKVATTAIRIYCALVRIGFTFGVRNLRKLRAVSESQKMEAPRLMMTQKTHDALPVEMRSLAYPSAAVYWVSDSCAI